jgi:hypothetical protein
LCLPSQTTNKDFGISCVIVLPRIATTHGHLKGPILSHDDTKYCSQWNQYRKKHRIKQGGGREKFNKRTTLQPEQKSTTPEKDQIKREIVREGIKKKARKSRLF